MTPLDAYRDSAADVLDPTDGPAAAQATIDAAAAAEPRVPTRTLSMPLQTVRPNIVQAIRAYRVDDLMQAAANVGQHFLYANLSRADSKQDVLDTIAESFQFPLHFGKNLDALYDCMTDLVHKAGPQPGFVLVLDQLPDNPRFDRETREQLLDVFRDAADFWAERKVAFRCFYSFL
jgi:RNAse (barnase) inhibitor barstar